MAEPTSLGGMFAQPGPPAQGQTPPEPGFNWPFIGGMLQAGAHGMNAARDPNYLLKLQAQQMQQRAQQEAEQRNAQIEKRRQGLAEIQTLGQLMDMDPRFRSLALQSLARSMNIKDDDPEIKELGQFLSKMDEEDSAQLKELMLEHGVEDPNGGFASLLKQIRDPVKKIEILSNLGKSKQKKSLDDAIKLAESGSKEPPEELGQPAPVQGGQPPPENVVAALDATMKAEESKLKALEKRMAAIMKAPVDSALKKEEIERTDKLIDNTRQRMSQIDAQKRGVRDDRRIDLQEQNMGRLASQFQQGQERITAQFNEAQDRSDARVDRQINSAMNRPLDSATQRDISELQGVIKQIDTIESNFDAKFLGPIKGTDMAFEVRRQAGGTIGSPLSEKETVFRQSLKDITDQLLRARSGAAINEAEYNRMIGILPKATDEPKVFKAGMRRFRGTMNSLLADRKKLGTTPRSQMGGGGANTADDYLKKFQ